MPKRANSNKGRSITIRIPRIRFKKPAFRLDFGAIKNNIANTPKGLLYISLLLIPLIYSTSVPFSSEFPKYSALLAITSLSAVILLAIIIRSKKFMLVQSPLLSLIVFFLLGYIVSAIFSIHPVSSIFGNRGTWIYGVLGIVAGCTLAIISANVFREKIASMRLIVFLMLSGFFTSILYLLITRILPILQSELVTGQFPPITENSVIASFMVITVSATAILLVDRYTIQLKVFLILVITAQIIVLINTGTLLQILFAGTIIIALLTVLFLRNRVPSKAVYTLAVAPLLVLFSLIAFLTAPPLRSVLPDSITNNSSVLAIQNEIEQWNPGLKIFKERPLTGIGPELLNTRLPQYSKEFVQNNLTTERVYYSFSSTFVNFLATTGVIGLIPFLVIGIYLIMELKQREKMKYHQKSLLAISLVFMYSLFVFPLSSLTVFIGFIILGATAAHLSQTTYFEKKHSGIEWYRLTPLVIVTAIIAISLYSLISAEFLYARSTTEKSPDNLETITEVVELNPYEAAYHRANAGYLMQYLQRNSQSGNYTEIERQIKQSINNALVFNPYYFLNLYSAAKTYTELANVVNNPSHEATSLSYITAAIASSPFDQRLYLERASTLLELENNAAALHDLNTATAIDPENWSMYLTAALILQKNEKFQESLPFIETVINNSQDEFYQSIALELLERIPVTIED